MSDVRAKFKIAGTRRKYHKIVLIIRMDQSELVIIHHGRVECTDRSGGVSVRDAFTGGKQIAPWSRRKKLIRTIEVLCARCQSKLLPGGVGVLRAEGSNPGL